MGNIEKPKDISEIQKKLQALKQVLEKKVKQDNNPELAEKLKQVDALEKETRKQNLKEAEKKDIEERYAAMEDLERQFAESDDEKTETKAPEAPKDFMTNLMSKIEHYKNFFAYHLAPIIASLQAIPLFAGDGNLTMLQAFLGGERTMLFNSIRKKNIQPTFNDKAPEKDSEAIAAMTKMAEDVHAIHAPYTIQRFFEKSIEAFSADLQTRGENKFTLQDLVTFTTANVLEKQKAAANAEKTAAPEVAKKTVELKQDKDNIIATKEGKEIRVKYDKTDKGVFVGAKKWKLFSMPNNKQVNILDLAMKDKATLSMKVDFSGEQLSEFEKDDLSNLFDVVSAADDAEPYPFTKPNPLDITGNNPFKFEFRPV